MKKAIIAGLCVGVAVMLQAGCGVVTAPISVPAAVATNGNFDPTFAVMRPDGGAVSGVLLEQTLNHWFWEPLVGGMSTHEQKNIQVGARVSVHERGELIDLKFSHPDYFDSHFWINGTDVHTIATELGRWKYVENFPVVMVPRSAPDAPLRLWQCRVDYADFPNQRIIELPKLWAAGTTVYPSYSSNSLGSSLSNAPGGMTNTFMPPTPPPSSIGRGGPPPYTTTRGPAVEVLREGNVTANEEMMPGSFYVTLTKQMPRAINAKGEVDPLEVNLPASLTLHVSGADGGFVRLEPRVGFLPMLTADEAPTSGYAAELTISRERLREMRVAESDRIVEAYEYFYIKSQGHFGKAYIAWSMGFDPKNKAPTPLVFRYGFWMQSLANDTNLTWHRGPAR